jgi:hypothetical protein
VSAWKPLAHVLHAVCSKRAGQKEQWLLAVHWSTQLQLQPMRELPLTDDAWLEQFAETVHFKTHDGYSSQPSTHTPQSCEAL